MNTGQMMLTILAVVLLGVTVITVNKTNMNTGVIVDQSETGIYAVSLATSYIEKAASLNFDENTVSSSIINGSTSTLSSTMGVETGETASVDSTFDDFDDYNQFSHTDLTNTDVFLTTAKVYYTDSLANPTGTTKTFFKRIDVATSGTISRAPIEGTTGVDTIKASYVYSYFAYFD